MEIVADHAAGICSDGCGDFCPDSSETNGARGAIAAAKRRTGTARADTAGSDEPERSSGEGRAFLAFRCGWFHASASGRGTTAFERSGAAFQTGAEHTASRTGEIGRASCRERVWI